MGCGLFGVHEEIKSGIFKLTNTRQKVVLTCAGILSSSNLGNEIKRSDKKIN
jgi:hypothetical protein